jgi:hypothetical protein
LSLCKAHFAVNQKKGSPLCHELFLAHGKTVFAANLVFDVSFSKAHGKMGLCREHDFWLTAKTLPHGDYKISGSASFTAAGLLLLLLLHNTLLAPCTYWGM